MYALRGMKWLLVLIFMQSSVLLYDSVSDDSHLQPALFALSLLLAITGLVVSLHLLLSAVPWGKPLQAPLSDEIQNERHRIASELHDTLGFQLLQALALLEAKPPQERHPAQELLEQSLFDLRLIVDTIDAPDDNLAMQMARLRHRLAPALERKGLILHWSLRDPELEAAPLSAPPLPRGKVAHQILKVFQESISNAIRHSGTSEIWVTLEPYVSENPLQRVWDWSLRIEDNGFGFDLQSVFQSESSSGQGIKNMFWRMRNIGADLRIQPRPQGGTQIWVRWRSQGREE